MNSEALTNSTAVQAVQHGIECVEHWYTNPEWWIAIATWMALASLWLIRWQTNTDHERSKRERAFDLMQAFAFQDATNHQLTFGLGLLHALTGDQARCLSARETFELEAKHEHMLTEYRRACGVDKPTSKKQNLTLSETEVHTLRRIAIVHLNRLELIASAWNDNVANRKMIEREFIKVFCPQEGKYVLSEFRAASGVYPSIEKLCEHFQNKKKNQSA